MSGLDDPSDRQHDNPVNNSVIQRAANTEPVMVVYFWKKRTSIPCCFRKLNIGHVAVKVKVPDRWYQYNFFLRDPIDRLLPPSYNAFLDGDSHWKVRIVHLEGVTEIVDLTKNGDTLTTESIYREHIHHFLMQQFQSSREWQNGIFPDALIKRIGQLSQYPHDSGHVYLSFSPQHTVTEYAQLWSTPGKIVRWDYEVENNGQPDDSKQITCLDNGVVYRDAIQLLERITKSRTRAVRSEELATFVGITKSHGRGERRNEAWQWGLGRGNDTCSSLALSLIDTLLKKRMPGAGRLGSLQSIALLSLRPAFTVSTLLPLCYSILFKGNQVIDVHPHHASPLAHHDLYAGIVSGLCIIEMAVLCVFEKYAIDFFPFLENKGYRKRELVETHGFSDCLVQLVAFSSVTLCHVWLDWTFLQTYLEHRANSTGLLIGDAVISLFGSVMVYGLSAFVTSMVCALFRGQCCNTPQFMDEVVSYIEKTNDIPDAVLALQFKKESALHWITICSILASSMTLRYADYLVEDDSYQPIFLGGSAAVFLLGYVATKATIFFINEKQKQAIITHPLSASAQQQLDSHDPDPEFFTAKTFFSGAALLVLADQFAGKLSPLIAMFMAMLVSTVCYTLPPMMYYYGMQWADENRHRFFGSARTPVSENTELLNGNNHPRYDIHAVL